MIRRSMVLTAAVAAIAATAVPAAQAAAAPFKLDIHFTNVPAKLTNQTSPSFSLHRNVHFGVRSQTCRVDTSAWKACSLVWKPGALKAGKHTAQARLVMTTGRSATAAYTWTIDTSAPGRPTITGAGTSWVRAASRQVTVHAADASGIASYSYRLNGGAVKTSTTGGITVTAQGATTISVTAHDRAGNTSPAATGTVKLDDVAPSVQAPQNLAAWTTSISIAAPSSSDTLSGIASQQWRRSDDGGQTWSAWMPPVAITVPSDGQWSFEYQATDQAGNAASVDFSQGQDTTPAPPPVISTSGHTLVLTQVDDDPQSGAVTDDQYQISTDNGQTWSTAADYTDPFTPLSPGTYLMRGRSQNSLGLWSDWSTPDAGATLVYSTVPTTPVVTYTAQDSADVTFNWAGSTDWGGDATSYEVQLFQDGNLVNDFTSPYAEMGLTDQYSCATWTLQGPCAGQLRPVVRLVGDRRQLHRPDLPDQLIGQV